MNIIDGMNVQEWLKECERWSLADEGSYVEGVASGIAINPETDKPYTMKDIKKIVESLPA